MTSLPRISLAALGIALVGPTPLAEPTLLELAAGVADHYLAPPGGCYRLVLPPAGVRASRAMVRLLKPGPTSDPLLAQLQGGPLRLSALGKRLGRDPQARLQRLRLEGLVAVEQSLDTPGFRQVRVAVLEREPEEPRGKAQAEVVERLRAAGGRARVAELLRDRPSLRGAVDRLVKTGTVRLVSERELRAPEGLPARDAIAVVPTEDQERSLADIAQRLNTDHSDGVGATVPCVTCQHLARYAGRHTKTFESVLGPLTLERAYYHCAACDAGFCPRDRALGLEGSSLSPGVLRMVGRVGAMVSFEEGHQLLRELAGVRVPPTHVERAAETLGREIAADERTVVEPPPAGEPVPPTLYLGMDGTGVPMRKEALQGRTGKQSDGSSKTREVKLCAVWSAEGRDDEGTPVRDAGSIRYSAAIESAAKKDTHQTPSAFAARVEREALRRAFDRAARRAVLGDGAVWIWNLASERFPDAVQIVDRFHAKQHQSTAPSGGMRR